MIFMTGDLHGAIDIHKLNSKNFPEGNDLTKDDYVIVAGDAGLLWDGTKRDQYWLEWLDEKPWTTLFVDGNHENFNLLYSYPIQEWKKGKVHKLNNSVLHLMRGQIYEIGGKKFFTFGGATSIDKVIRVEGVSWWSQELPSVAECEEGLNNLELNNNEVDYIITHCCSEKILPKVSTLRGYKYDPDILNKYFTNLESRVKFKQWYFGHYHSDEVIDENHVLLYKKIIKIED